MRMRSPRKVNRTVNTPLSTKPKQKYLCSLALWPRSSAMTRFGSRNACCARSNPTPCLRRFSKSFPLSHSKPTFGVVWQDYHTKVWLSPFDWKCQSRLAESYVTPATWSSSPSRGFDPSGLRPFARSASSLRTDRAALALRKLTRCCLDKRHNMPQRFKTSRPRGTIGTISGWRADCPWAGINVIKYRSPMEARSDCRPRLT